MIILKGSITLKQTPLSRGGLGEAHLDIPKGLMAAPGASRVASLTALKVSTGNRGRIYVACGEFRPRRFGLGV